MASKTARQARRGSVDSKRAHECGENRVALEALADVLGAFRADVVIVKTARGQTRSNSGRQPLLTTKRAHSELGWGGSGRALERGQYRVLLQSLADALEAPIANLVSFKTARVKQGRSNHNLSTPAHNKASTFRNGKKRARGSDVGEHLRSVRALLLLRASPMCWAPP
eukprot:scaffold6533_cov117-Isochrysis_galbana.AAC.4